MKKYAPTDKAPFFPPPLAPEIEALANNADLLAQTRGFVEILCTAMLGSRGDVSADSTVALLIAKLKVQEATNRKLLTASLKRP